MCAVVPPNNAFAVMAACSMVAVVREGTAGMWDAEVHDDDSVALENNTMADKTEWWSDCVVYNSSEPDAELHDDSAALGEQHDGGQ